jgi:pimeloyl-ACP methyl ester carboxylesterase
MDALRSALGLEKINLMGFSYGTHLALATIRRHGDRIANAVLIGTEGPDHTLKLPWTMDTQWRKIALMAAADSELSRVVPDFDALLRRVLARLDADPMVVSVQSGGATIQLPIGSAGLAFMLRRDIGDASDLPVLPRLIYSIDQGDPSLLTWFVQKRYQLGAHVMSCVMVAASGASPSRLAQIEAESATSRFGAVGNFPWPDDVRSIDVPDLGAAFRSPLVSSVRTLLLSGTLDYNTPPFQAEEVRWGLPNSWHVIVRNAGHEQILPHPAVGPAIVRFLRGEDVGDVTAAYPPLRFVPLTGHDPARTHPSVPRP